MGESQGDTTGLLPGGWKMSTGRDASTGTPGAGGWATGSFSSGWTCGRAGPLVCSRYRSTHVLQHTCTGMFLALFLRVNTGYRPNTNREKGQMSRVSI